MFSMTVAVRDHISNGAMLVRFDVIAACLEPDAATCSWRVRYVDGMLAQNHGSYTLDDADAEADASLESPMSWYELKSWSSRFFQIYDSEFEAVGGATCDDLKICCIDSGHWEITTGNRSIIERLCSTFKLTEEVRDH